MRVLIVGCGYIGSAVGKCWVEEGHEVIGVVRSSESANRLKPLGISPRMADCSQIEEAHMACEKNVDVVIFSVSSRGGDYQRTYVDSMQNILKVLWEHPPRLFLYTGSTSVYAQNDEKWVTEESPTESHGNGELLLKAEQLLMRAAHECFSAYVLRLSGIYGPGRHVLLDQLRGGIETLPGDGNRWMNYIHRDDVVGAILHLVRLDARTNECRVLNLTDDVPVLQQDYVEWICSRMGRAMPRYSPESEWIGRKGRGRSLTNRRISNALIRKLGYSPIYPSYREGLIPLM